MQPWITGAPKTEHLVLPTRHPKEQPYFVAIIKARRRVETSTKALTKTDALGTDQDGYFHVAVRGPPEMEEWANNAGPLAPEPGSAMLRLVEGEDVVAVANLADTDDYRDGVRARRAIVDIGG
jgi:hypothetical protein